jgi:hypothetical protein
MTDARNRSRVNAEADTGQMTIQKPRVAQGLFVPHARSAARLMATP